jgi:hypothetical protein
VKFKENKIQADIFNLSNLPNLAKDQYQKAEY